MMCRFSDKAKQTWNLHVNCHQHLALKCNTEYNLSCVFKVGTEVPPFIDLFFNSQRYFSRRGVGLALIHITLAQNALRTGRTRWSANLGHSLWPWSIKDPNGLTRHMPFSTHALTSQTRRDPDLRFKISKSNLVHKNHILDKPDIRKLGWCFHFWPFP